MGSLYSKLASFYSSKCTWYSELNHRRVCIDISVVETGIGTFFHVTVGRTYAYIFIILFC